MSWKNLKLNTWTHPKTGEVRVYISTRFVEFRDPMHDADGAYIYADEAGMCAFGHKAFQDFGMALDAEMSREAVKSFLGGDMLFYELLRRMTECSTKGGNFSAVKYEKMGY